MNCYMFTAEIKINFSTQDQHVHTYETKIIHPLSVWSFIYVDMYARNGVARTLKMLRTSKGDYYIKQWFSTITSLFKIWTSLEGKNLKCVTWLIVPFASTKMITNNTVFGDKRYHLKDNTFHFKNRIATKVCNSVLTKGVVCQISLFHSPHSYIKMSNTYLDMQHTYNQKSHSYIEMAHSYKDMSQSYIHMLHSYI